MSCIHIWQRPGMQQAKEHLMKKMIGHNLRNDINFQGALEEKVIKQAGVKHRVHSMK